MLLSLKLRQKVKIAAAHQFSCETIKGLHPKTGSWSNADYCSNTNRGWDGGEKKHGTFEDVMPHLQPADRFRMSRVGVCLCGWGVEVGWGGTSAANPPRDTRMEMSTNWCNKGRVPPDSRGGNGPPLSWKRWKHSLKNRCRVQIESASVELEKSIPSCDPKDPSLNRSVNKAQPGFAPVLFAGCASLFKHTDQSPVCQRTAQSLPPCVLHFC